MPTQDNNTIKLVGRVSQQPQERELPSGDRLVTFRVIVPRGDAGHSRQSHSRQSVDALECAAWTARCRRTIAQWHPDDVVEVTGSLRRRFYATPTGRSSRVEVEVSGARRLERAVSPAGSA